MRRLYGSYLVKGSHHVLTEQAEVHIEVPELSWPLGVALKRCGRVVLGEEGSLRAEHLPGGWNDSDLSELLKVIVMARQKSTQPSWPTSRLKAGLGGSEGCQARAVLSCEEAGRRTGSLGVSPRTMR